MPHRPAPRRASSCTASSATSCTPRCARATYTIFGYKGKQVRDQIHSADVDQRVLGLRPGPAAGRGLQPRRRQGQRRQPARVRRADRRRRAAASGPTLTYDEQARVGDHICYYSDMAKFRAHYPGWRQEHDLAGHRRGDGGRGRARSSADGAPRAPDAAQPVLRAGHQPHRPAGRVARRAPRRAAATRSPSSPAGPATSRASRPTARRADRARPADPPGVDARPRQVVASPGACSATSPSSSAAPCGCSLLPRQDVIVAMTTPPFVVVARAAPPAAPPPHPRRAVEHGLLPRRRRALRRAAPGGLVSRAAARRQPVGVPPPRPRGRRSTAPWSSCSRRSTPPGPDRPAVRGHPQLGAGRRCSPPTRRPSRGTGYDDARRRGPHGRALPRQHRRRPPVRHRARRRRAPRRRGRSSSSSAAAPGGTSWPTRWRERGPGQRRAPRLRPQGRDPRGDGRRRRARSSPSTSARSA